MEFNSLDAQREACGAYIASPKVGGLGRARQQNTTTAVSRAARLIALPLKRLLCRYRGRSLSM